MFETIAVLMYVKEKSISVLKSRCWGYFAATKFIAMKETNIIMDEVTLLLLKWEWGPVSGELVFELNRLSKRTNDEFSD